MQTTRTRRGSSFQERDSEGRFTNRSRGNGYRYENDYNDDRFGNRSSRYDENDFEDGGYGRSSNYQGDQPYYDEDYLGNRGRRAYDNSAEYDDEDYDYDVNRYDEDEDDDYGTRGRYDREERWGRRDFSSLNRGEFRNQPRGMHNSGRDNRSYGNVSGRRDYNTSGGFNGGGYEGGSYRQGGGYGSDRGSYEGGSYRQGRGYGSDRGGYEGGSYREGRGYGPDTYESGLSSRRSSGRGQGFASMPREEVQRIGSMGGRAASRNRRSSRSGGSQRSTRSRSRR